MPSCDPTSASYMYLCCSPNLCTHLSNQHNFTKDNLELQWPLQGVFNMNKAIYLRSVLEWKGTQSQTSHGLHFFISIKKHPKEVGFQNCFLNKFLGQSKGKMWTTCKTICLIDPPKSQLKPTILLPPSCASPAPADLTVPLTYSPSLLASQIPQTLLTSLRQTSFSTGKTSHSEFWALVSFSAESHCQRLSKV